VRKREVKIIEGKIGNDKTLLYVHDWHGGFLFTLEPYVKYKVGDCFTVSPSGERCYVRSVSYLEDK